MVRYTEGYHTYVMNQTSHGLLRIVSTGILHRYQEFYMFMHKLHSWAGLLAAR